MAMLAPPPGAAYGGQGLPTPAMSPAGPDLLGDWEEEEEAAGDEGGLQILREEAQAEAVKEFKFESTLAWQEARYWQVSIRKTTLHGLR